MSAQRPARYVDSATVQRHLDAWAVGYEAASRRAYALGVMESLIEGLTYGHPNCRRKDCHVCRALTQANSLFSAMALVDAAETAERLREHPYHVPCGKCGAESHSQCLGPNGTPWGIACDERWRAGRELEITRPQETPAPTAGTRRKP